MASCGLQSNRYNMFVELGSNFGQVQLWKEMQSCSYSICKWVDAFCIISKILQDIKSPKLVLNGTISIITWSNLYVDVHVVNFIMITINYHNPINHCHVVNFTMENVLYLGLKSFFFFFFLSHCGIVFEVKWVMCWTVTT